MYHYVFVLLVYVFQAVLNEIFNMLKIYVLEYFYYFVFVYRTVERVELKRNLCCMQRLYFSLISQIELDIIVEDEWNAHTCMTIRGSNSCDRFQSLYCV